METEFKIGTRVYHAQFGIGEIIPTPEDVQLEPTEIAVQFTFNGRSVPCKVLKKDLKQPTEEPTAPVSEASSVTPEPVLPAADLEARVRSVMAKGAIAPDSALPIATKTKAKASASDSAKVVSAIVPTTPAKTLHPAPVYLSGLFESNDRVCIQLIHATEQWAPGQYRTDNLFRSLEETIDDGSLEHLRMQQESGWQIYIALSPFVAGAVNRTEKNISAIRSAYFEVDENGEAVLADVRNSAARGEIPAPHFIIESSPKKYQFVFRMESGLTLAQQRSLNIALCDRFHGDHACVDGARVFRVPGFYNLKPKYQEGGQKAPLVKIVEQTNQPPLKLTDFKIPVVFTKGNNGSTQRNSEVKTIAPEKLRKMMQVVEENCEKADVALNDWIPYEDGFKNIPDECPDADEHKNGHRDGMMFTVTSKGYGGKCFHSHAAGVTFTSAGGWRDVLDERAGEKLNWLAEGERPPLDVNFGDGSSHGSSNDEQKAAKDKAAVSATPAATVETMSSTPTATAAQMTTSTAPAKARRLMSLIHAKDVKPKHVRWSWQGRILANKPNVFFGEPGLGKGFISDDFIASMTTGRDFPDGPNTNEPCDVLICCAEESVSETIVPRLVVAGADMNRVHFMYIKDVATDSIKEGLMRLDTDLPALRGLLRRYPDIRIVKIDPLATYMGELDPNKDKECRPLYTELARVAEEDNVCFLLIAHPNKNEEASAINRLSGAKALTSVFRNTWIIEKHPDDKGARLMMTVKANLAGGSATKALKFRVINVPETNILGEDGKPIRNIGKLIWEGTTDHEADNVLQATANGGKERKRKIEAQNTLDLLKDFLKNGARPATDFYQKASELDITEHAVLAAKNRARVKWERVAGTVYWALSKEDLEAKKQELFEPKLNLGSKPPESIQ
jgi:AAA domain/RepB DNA-primase from phage plasmid